MVTAADIINLPSGEFSSADYDQVQGFVDEAAREVGAVFGDRRDEAIRNLAAHNFARAKLGGAAPSTGLVAVTVGAMSKQYGQPSFSDTDVLNTTAYGHRYVQIRQQVVGGAWAL